MAFTRPQAERYTAYLTAKGVGRLVDGCVQECCKEMPPHPQTHIARHLLDAHTRGTRYPKAGGQHAASAGGLQVSELERPAAASNTASVNNSPQMAHAPSGNRSLQLHVTASGQLGEAVDALVPKVSGRAAVRFDRRKLESPGWLERVCQGVSSYFLEQRADLGKGVDRVVITVDPRAGNAEVAQKLQRCLVGNRLKPVLADHLGGATPSAAASMLLHVNYDAAATAARGAGGGGVTAVDPAAAATATAGSRPNNTSFAVGGEGGGGIGNGAPTTAYLGGVAISSNLPGDTIALHVLTHTGAVLSSTDMARLDDFIRSCESWVHVADLAAAVYEGAILKTDILGTYVDALDRLFDFDAMAAALHALVQTCDPVALVIDCSHGTAGAVVREIFLRRLHMAENQNVFLLRETPRVDLGFANGHLVHERSGSPSSASGGGTAAAHTLAGERLWSATETRLGHVKEWLAAHASKLPGSASRRVGCGVCVTAALSIDGSYSAVGDSMGDVLLSKAEELGILHAAGVARWAVHARAGGARAPEPDRAAAAAAALYEMSPLTPPCLPLLLEHDLRTTAGAPPPPLEQTFHRFATAAAGAALGDRGAEVAVSAPFAPGAAAAAAPRWSVHEETHTLHNPCTEREDAIFNLLALVKTMLARKMTVKGLLEDQWDRCGRVYYARGLLWCKGPEQKTRIRRLLDGLCATPPEGRLYSGLPLIAAATNPQQYTTWTLTFGGANIVKLLFAHSSTHGTGLQVHCYAYRTNYADSVKTATQGVKNAFSEVMRQHGWEGDEAFTDAELYL